MFEAIERRKNGHIVSTMYGRYAKASFDHPQIFFCTNRPIYESLDNLSRDRWFQMKINESTGTKSLRHLRPISR